MAKKRKAGSRNAAPSGPKEVDPRDARLGPIKTFEDVADSEDEFFINRDRIMMDDEPDSKRRRKEDDDMELSDEEVFAYDDDSEDSDVQNLKKLTKAARAAKKTSKKQEDDDDQDDEEEGEEEEDQGWWGSSKKEYYDVDNIETEADALEEEAEAKRLQQKKLSKMTDEDFVFDGDAWAAAEPEEDDQGETVTEVLKDVEVTEDMGPEERYTMLKTRYPEFEHLVAEFHESQPQLEQLKSGARSKPADSVEAIKYWVLGCYVASLASYFAILTSPARDASKESKTLDPSELRDHEIMETLLECREAWRKVKDLKSLSDPGELGEVEAAYIEEEVIPKEAKTKKKSKDKPISEKQAKKLAKAKAAAASVADLYDLPLTASTKRSKSKVSQKDADSDFGEETALDARTAAEKAARKKTLKFYTSQIAQKANKRADAGRDAGGDNDLPYRERLKDRQARLMAEAERRGQKGSKRGADLGDDSDEDDTAAANAMRNDEDDYYDMVAHKAQSKKDDKAARYAAYAAAGKADRVVEKEDVDEDGKRKISYAIEKNKGLAPKRKKENRNPRVKKRMQYEAKQKKLASMRPVWKGGEPKGGYQGETSGINANVVRNVRL
jgi:U3 small nucleolar RNA-associated protein 3